MFPIMTPCSDRPLPLRRINAIRWAAEVMRPSAPSHILPSVSSRSRLVLPVSAPWVVPSLPFSVRAAAACPGTHGDLVAIARPLSLGRVARVTLVRHVSSSARRGRRSASADFHANGVACGGGGFASRHHSAAAALVPARIPPGSRVNRSGPTHRSRGSAPKAAQPPQLKR